jgi:hypothetical protein
LVTEELISDNNGKSFTSMNTLSQRKVNWTKESVYMLKETSTLYQHSQVEDTLI